MIFFATGDTFIVRESFRPVEFKVMEIDHPDTEFGIVAPETIIHRDGAPSYEMHAMSLEESDCESETDDAEVGDVELYNEKIAALLNVLGAYLDGDTCPIVAEYTYSCFFFISMEGARVACSFKALKCSRLLLSWQSGDYYRLRDIKLDSTSTEATMTLVKYMKLRLIHGEPPEIEKPLKSTDMSEVVVKWQSEFCSHFEDQNILFEIIQAANYLDIKCLLDLSCAKVMTKLPFHFIIPSFLKGPHIFP